VTDYFDVTFEATSFVMFAKEINSPNWNGIAADALEWSYIKMGPLILGHVQNSMRHGKKRLKGAEVS
jgi:hypothetical protein